MPTTLDAVTAAEIIRNFGFWQQRAMVRPLTITHHGRARVMLIAVDEYERLQSLEVAGGGAGEVDADSKLDAVLENMTEGFILFDRDFRVTRMNGVAEGWFGRPRRELMHKDPKEVFGEIYDSLIAEGLRNAARNGEVTSFEAQSVLFPGRRILLRVFPYRDGIGLLFTNITQMERLKAKTAEYAACNAAIEASPTIGMVRLDGRGRPVSVDAAFETMSGFKLADLGAVRIFDLFASAYRRRITTAFEDAMADRKVSEMKAELVTREGGERHVHLSIAPQLRDFAAEGAVMLLTESAA